MNSGLEPSCRFNTLLVYPAVQNSPNDINFVFIMALTRYAQDYPYVTYFYVDEDVSGNADVDAILVMDGISDAWVSPY